MQRITIIVDRDLWTRFYVVAREKNTSRAALIREFISEQVDAIDGPATAGVLS